MYGFIFGSRYRNYYCLVLNLNIIYKQKIRSNRRLAKVSDYLLLVEMAVVETASENPLPQLSTSVSALLGFPSGDAGRQASPYGSL